MRKAIAAALLAGLFLCAGCFTAPPPPLLSPRAPQVIEAPPPPPVRPGDVKQENARTKLQEISDEIDRAEQENLSGRWGD